MKLEVPFSPTHPGVKIVFRSPLGESSYSVESSTSHVEVNDREWAEAEEVIAYFCGANGHPDPAALPITIKDRSDAPPQETADSTASAGDPSGDAGDSAPDLPAGDHVPDEGWSAEPVGEAPTVAADSEAEDGSGDEAPSAEAGVNEDLSDEELEALTKPADPPVADHLRD